MLIKVETEKQIRARLEQWHDKFAFLPVKISDGQWAWLETVSRKAVYSNLSNSPTAEGLMDVGKAAVTANEWAFKHWTYRRKPSRDAGNKS